MRDQWTTTAKGRKVLVRSKTKAPGQCAVLRCRNKAKPRSSICHSCERAEVRANNPLWAEWHDKAYRHTRRRIKGKERPCCTFQEWADFHATKPTPDHVVDRIDPLGGYTVDNMRWLTYEENASKGATFDKEAYAEHKRHCRLVDEIPAGDHADTLTRLATDHPEQFNAITGNLGDNFTPTDNEPF